MTVTTSSVRTTRRRDRRRQGAWASPASLLEQLETRQLLAADPIAPSGHPTWFAVYGEPRVDGVVSASEWAGSVPIVRAQPNQYNSAVTVRVMYNTLGLFVAVEAQDDRVWIDGNGGGTGNRWEFDQDDSVGLYFDPSNRRDRFLGPTGRFLGTNLGRPLAPQSGTGPVTRIDYLQGNGAGWGGNVNPGGALTSGMTWRSRIYGTANNNNDIDKGWSIEYYLPWNSVGMTGTPSNGQFIGMNFQVFFDNTGGTRDFATADQSADPNVRLGARIVDDEIQGVHSSYSYTWSGFEGPVNYAQLTFVNPYQSDSPRAPRELVSSAVTGYAATLNFRSPYVSQTRFGSTSSYQIRVSQTPITDESSWDAASPVRNSFHPKVANQREALRIGGLSPSTTYYVGVRGVDAAGRPGAISSTTLTTQSTAQDASAGQRVMVSPAGGQLITESGTPWVMNGSHAVVNTRYIRNLYDGDIWNPATQSYINFYQNPGPEGDARGYLESLASYGVNTLRVHLEWIPLENTPAARANAPRGVHWIESRPGVFNPAMRDFLQRMMAESARVGIKLVLDPFNTYNFRNFFELTPYSAANGGPLTNIDDFYSNATVFEMAVRRMTTVIDWVNASPYRSSVIGIEPVNEWDALAWNMNPNMLARASFMTRLSSRVRAYDPTMLLIHTGNEVVPRGPVARTVFNSDAFDVLAPHLYTRTTSEPVNNPDADKSIRPAVDYAGITQYWISYRRDNRPVHNGEWGLTSWNWSTNRPYYTGISSVADPAKPWTVADDVAMYRTTAWSSLASGASGPGFRLGGPEMRDLTPSGLRLSTHGYLPLPFPTGMREVQKSLNRFVTDTRLGIDWANFDATTLAGRISVGAAPARSVLTFGVTDSRQGVAYVLKNSNRVSTALDNVTLGIAGLDATRTYSIEVWSAGTNADVVRRIDGVSIVGGRLSFTLPTLGTDLMVKFRAV